MLVRLLSAAICLVSMTLAVPALAADDTKQGDAKTDGSAKLLPGRSKTGLPPEGYTDSEQIPGQPWLVHDRTRPEVSVVAPGTSSSQQQPGKAPSDAVVLFDGSNLDQWVNGKGKPAAWLVKDGYMEVNGAGSIRTKEGFGSCQLHIEFASPDPPKRKSQGRGNSGVMIMGLYEIQVLDSFNNRTYSDGQAGAIYGQYPPLVNASRPPGEWQTFDIIFEAPEYKDGKVTKSAFITVIHNGVLVHHRAKVLGRVAHKFAPKYKPHADKLPLMLQDHGNPVRFRNIWVRPMTGYDEGR